MKPAWPDPRHIEWTEERGAMANNPYGTNQQQGYFRRNRGTIFVLILCLAIAATTRVAFNYDAAITDGGVYRYAGNDDYYHQRVVQHVQETGNHLVEDPLLNYPVPAKNPRPPVYDWSVAIIGQVTSWVTPMESAEAGQYALEWGSAIWGILLVLPTWLLGRTLFNNTAGLWAAFLIAASPANIQRSGFGLGDHDAFILFFLVLGAFFIVRALQHTREEVLVSSWTDMGSIARGFTTYASRHPQGLAYSFLGGVSWATIALMWEGFPYALAIYAIYYFIQTLTNHIRRRDSTGDLLNMMVLVGTILVMALPFYWQHGNIGSTITSANYILIGLLIISAVLVATRDLPWILIVPTLAGVALLGLLVITLLLPAIGRQIFTANGYFVQSRLYSTIAEAQRTDLGVFVFSVGLMTFFLALIGFGFVVAAVARRWERPHVFMLGWAFVAMYMAFAASRFVYNSTPVFAVLGGWTVARFVRWMDLRTARRNFSSLKRDSVARAARSTLTGKVVVGVLFLLLLLIIPNLWFSVDAGIPGEFRAQVRENHPGQRDLIANRTGAFGQGFLGQNWIRTYEWLSEQDAVGPDGQPQSCAERPAHSAWWDYGFWEVALGCHPTVADNFQNGYQLTGRHLAAQGEREGIEWWIIRVLEGDKKSNEPRGEFSSATVEQLDAARSGLAGELLPLMTPSRYNEAQGILRNATSGLEETVDLYEAVQESSGFRIHYFLVDDRMMPFDDPRTPNIDSGSIFYAPVFLANKNPDDFVQTVYQVQGGTYRVEAYRTTPDGDVVQQRPSKIVAGGREFTVSGGQLYRMTEDGKRIDYTFGAQGGSGGVPIESIALDYKDQFYETMFFRAFAGTRPEAGFLPTSYDPGEGLVHHRLVRQHGDPFGVKLLKYYPGALVSGTVEDDTGSPMTGIQVQAVDDFGIRHHRVDVAGDGTFTVIAPFGLPDSNGTLQPTKIQAVAGGAVLAEGEVAITEAAAYRREAFEFTVDLRVTTGNLTGLVYLDEDRNGQYNASVDRLADGARVSIEGGPSANVGANGEFLFSGLQPGSRRVNATGIDGYEPATRTVSISSEETTNTTLGLKVARTTVSGTISQDAPPAYQVNATALQPDVDRAESTSATADVGGNFTLRLYPGQYELRAVVGDTAYVTTVEVAIGQDPVTLSASDWSTEPAGDEGG